MKSIKYFLILTYFACLCPTLKAGIHSAQVLVVSPKNHAIGKQYAQYYMAARDVPASHHLELILPHKKETISEQDYLKYIETPILNVLKQKGRSQHVSYVLLSKGMPIRVQRKTKPNRVSLSWLLKGGHKRLSNLNRPKSVFYLSAWNFEEFKAMVDRSVQARSTRPKGTFYLCEGKGRRGVRRIQMPFVEFILKQRGFKVYTTKESDVTNKMNIMAYFTGATHVSFKGNKLLPGAIGDHLTSFGGRLYDRPKEKSMFDFYKKKKEVQMSILDYIKHGASASYGNLEEPTNHLARHSNLELLCMYTEGYTAGESYEAAVQDSQFGIFVGDPLTAPYGRFADIHNSKDAVEIHAPRPFAITKVDLWKDGRYHKTLFPSEEKAKGSMIITQGPAQWEFKLKKNEALVQFVKRIALESENDFDFPFIFRALGTHIFIMQKDVYQPLGAYQFLTSGRLKLGQAIDRIAHRSSPAKAGLFIHGEAKKGDRLQLRIGQQKLEVSAKKKGDSLLKQLALLINQDTTFSKLMVATITNDKKLWLINKRGGLSGNGLSLKLETQLSQVSPIQIDAYSGNRLIKRFQSGKVKMTFEGGVSSARLSLIGPNVVKLPKESWSKEKKLGLSVRINDLAESAVYHPIK